MSNLPSCIPTDLFETEVRCENGILNIYRRNIIITVGDFILKSDGCCSSSASSATSSNPSASSSSIFIPCCPDVLFPEILSITLYGDTDCECLNGHNFNLVFDYFTEHWLGSTEICEQTIDFDFNCYDNPSWSLLVTPGTGATGVPVSCDPFIWNTAPLTNIFDFCTGNTSAVITF